MPISKKSRTKKPLINENSLATKGEYYYAVGRRKNSVVSVKMFPAEKAGENDLIINGRRFKDYFPTQTLQNVSLSPFKATGTVNNFKLIVRAKGGGVRGQSEALRLAISRALVKYNQDLKKNLRSLGFLTCDARMVERKKAGLKKARRAPQWAKR